MLESIRGDLEGLNHDLGLEYYLALSGQKPDAEMAPIYAKYPRVSQRESIDVVRAALVKAEADKPTDSVPRAWGEAPTAIHRRGLSDEVRRLRFLLEAVILTHLDERVKEQSDDLLNREASATVQAVGGRKFTFRSALAALGNESDRDRRGALAVAINTVFRDTNGLRGEMHGALHSGARSLRYPAYTDMIEDLCGYSVTALRDALAGFLKRTEDVYREHMKWLLKRDLGLAPGDARRDDLAYLLRAHSQTRYFPKEPLVERATGMVASMGIDPRAEGRIHFDTEERPQKSPRAFCSPCRVPEEVYLVIQPAGGHGDYAAFLHEYGHAMHFAWTRAGEPVEYRYLGDNSLTEGFAITMDHLLMNPEWLRRVVEHPQPKEFLREYATQELYILRRYAAKVTYECDLHAADGPDGMAGHYAELMSAAAGVPFPPEMYLYDVDRHFYVTRYLRAWMMEACLSSALTQRFGEDWFRNPKTGPFLQALWSTGQRDTADELVRRIGAEGLSPEPMLERVTRYLD
ncbi:MAG: hypothetical protein HYY93_04060 [Planctomycetes bacterium]|nr:hypothetical protein [Planctomycetota bacterium]